MAKNVSRVDQHSLELDDMTDIGATLELVLNGRRTTIEFIVEELDLRNELVDATTDDKSQWLSSGVQFIRLYGRRELRPKADS